MAGRQVVIDIIGDSKKYTKATDDAVKSSKGLGGVLDKLDAKMSALGRRGGISGALMGGVGIGAGLGVFNLVERGISGVADALGNAVQSAIEDEKATAQLTQTIRANVAAWDGSLDAVNAAIDAGAQLAFTDDEVRDGLNQLIPRTKDLAEANRLNALAMDLARAKNMGLEEAATLVGKAYSGQASALRRAGIAIKNTKDSTKALAELQAAVSGQASTYANSTEGAMKRLDIQMSEALESLGYALKPLVASLASLASSIIPTVVQSIGLFGEAMHNLNRLADPTLAGVEDLNYAIIAQASAYGVSADAVIKYKDAVMKARKEAALRLELEDQLQKQLSENDDYFVRQAKINNITKDEAKNRFISGQITRIMGLTKAWGMSLEELRQANPLLLTTQDTVASFLKKLAETTLAYQEMGKTAEAVTPTMAEQGLEFIRMFKAMDATTRAGQAVTGMFEGLFSSAHKAGAALSPSNPEGPAAATQRTTKAMLRTMDDVMGPWRAAWKQAMEWARDPFSKKKFGAEMKRLIGETMKEAAEAGAKGLLAKQKRLIQVARAMRWALKHNFTDPARTDIGLIVKALALVDTIMAGAKAASQKGGGKGGKKKPGHKATGGPVSAGGSYLVGERGPELLQMGNQGGSIIPNHRLGGGSTYIINVAAPVGADEASIGRTVVKAIKAYERRDGRGWRAA